MSVVSLNIWLSLILFGCLGCSLLILWTLLPIIILTQVKASQWCRNPLHQRLLSHVMSIAACFAAGIFVAFCFFQMLPQARACLLFGLSPASEYPNKNDHSESSRTAKFQYWSKQPILEVFVILGFLLVLLVDQMINNLQARSEPRVDDNHQWPTSKACDALSPISSDYEARQPAIKPPPPRANLGHRRRSVSVGHQISIKKLPAFQRLLNEEIASRGRKRRSATGNGSSPTIRGKETIIYPTRQTPRLDSILRHSSGSTISSDDDEVWADHVASRKSSGRLSRCDSCLIRSDSIQKSSGGVHAKNHGTQNCEEAPKPNTKTISLDAICIIICLGLHLVFRCQQLSNEYPSVGLLLQIISFGFTFCFSAGIILAHQMASLKHAVICAGAIACCLPIGIVLGIFEQDPTLRICCAIIMSLSSGCLLCIALTHILAVEFTNQASEGCIQAARENTRKSSHAEGRLSKRKISSEPEVNGLLQGSKSSGSTSTMTNTAKATRAKFFGLLKVMSVLIGCSSVYASQLLAPSAGLNSDTMKEPGSLFSQ